MIRDSRCSHKDKEENQWTNWHIVQLAIKRGSGSIQGNKGTSFIEDSGMAASRKDEYRAMKHTSSQTVIKRSSLWIAAITQIVRGQQNTLVSFQSGARRENGGGRSLGWGGVIDLRKRTIAVDQDLDRMVIELPRESKGARRAYFKNPMVAGKVGWEAITHKEMGLYKGWLNILCCRFPLISRVWVSS